MRRFIPAALVLALFLAACAPRLVRPAAPRAELTGIELVTLDPFADRFAVRLRLRVTNPNAFDLPVTGSELTVRLGGWTAKGTLPALTLPAQGVRETAVPVESGLTPAASVARAFFQGRSLPLALTARLRVEALGQRIWLGPYTLLQDRVRLPLRLVPPKLTLRSASVSIGPGQLALKVRFFVENPLPVGFSLKGRLAARVAGSPVGALPLDLRLSPLAREAEEVRLELPLSAIPGAAQALAGGAPFALSGELRAEVPGIYAASLPFELSGSAR